MQESVKHKELAKHRTAAVLKREQGRAAKGNTLDKITEKFREGPLLLLRRYYKTSVRLQVVTRHASGVRGTATGTASLVVGLVQLVRYNGCRHRFKLQVQVTRDTVEYTIASLDHV